MPEINSLSDDSLRKIAAMLRQSGYNSTPTVSDRNATISGDSYDNELWGYTVGPATAASESGGVMTPGEGVLQVHRRKSGSTYTSTAELVTFQNFGSEIADGVWLSIKRDRAARRWGVEAVRSNATTFSAGTTEHCSCTISNVINVVWTDNLDGAGTGSGAGVLDEGSATLTYYASGAFGSGDAGWYARSDDWDASEKVGFGILGNDEDNPILAVAFKCIGGELKVQTNWFGSFSFGSTTHTPPVGDCPDYTFTSASGSSYDVTISVSGGTGASPSQPYCETAAVLTATNPTLDECSFAIESDTGKFKIGDGSTAWNDLSYGNPATVAAADITDISANGASLITAADYAAMKALLDLEIGTDVQAYDADLDTWAGITPSANAQSLVSAASYAAMRALLDLEPGTDFYSIAAADAAFQAASANLDTWSGLAPSANGQSIVTAANYAAMRALLDLEIGTDVQAYDADLTTWAGITPSANAQSLVSAANYAAMRALLDLEAGTDFYSISAADSAFATAAQGATADSALQNITGENLTDLSDVDTDKSKTPADGDVLTFDGTDWNAEAAGGGLSNIVEDTTPQLGGELDAQGNNIIDLADVTFRTGASGGTLRTGTSAADKFVLQAYDVNSTTYRTLIEADAGNDVVLQIIGDYLAIEDATDTTKHVEWDISGATTSTATTLDFNQTAARTITFPDATGTIALTSDLSSLTYTAVKTSAYTAAAGDYVLCDVETTGSFIVTLPSSPSANDTVGVVLDTKTTAGRYVDINPGTETIHGSTTDIRMTIRYWSMVLKYDGTEWKIIEDGRFELIATSTITSSTATMAFADDWSVFNSLRLELANYLPVTDNADLQMRVSTNLGSSYDSTSGNYSWQSQFGVTSSSGGFGIVSATSMRVVSNSQFTTAFGSASIKLIDPNDTAPLAIISDNVPIDSSGNLADHRCGGYYVPASAVNGFQLFPSSGNISKLKARLYGIR